MSEHRIMNLAATMTARSQKSLIDRIGAEIDKRVIAR